MLAAVGEQGLDLDGAVFDRRCEVSIGIDASGG